MRKILLIAVCFVSSVTAQVRNRVLTGLLSAESKDKYKASDLFVFGTSTAGKSVTRRPVWTEISTDGHFGYIVGTFQYPLADSAAYGNYIDIWKKPPYGTEWELFVRAEVTAPKPGLPSEALSFPEMVIDKYPLILPRIIEGSKNILLSTDVIFSTLLKTRDADQAYSEYLSSDARFLTEGSPVIRGPAGILGYLKSHKGAYGVSTTGASVSISRELGFTYGKGEFADAYRNKPDDYRFDYLRVWRKKNGLWNIIAEVRIRKR